MSDRIFQLYHLGSNELECYRSDCHESLQEIIHYYWWLNVLTGEVQLDVIPDNAMDLVMSPDIPGLSLL